MEKVTQYEYEYITFRGGMISYEETRRSLNVLGKQGWQLVSPPEQAASIFEMAAIFMRERRK